MGISVNSDELSSSQIRRARNKLGKAEGHLKKVSSRAGTTYGYEGRQIFYSQLAEIQACYSAISELSNKLDKYSAIMDTGPDALIDIDRATKNDISTGWERTLYTIGGFFGLFSSGSISAKTGSVVDVGKIADKAGKDAYDKRVDADRGLGNTTGDKQITYSSKSHKIVNGIFPDSHYNVTTYNDYREIYYSETEGDNFYNTSGGVNITGQHIEIEAMDGTEIALDLNEIDVGLSGDFDLEKGNAYVKSGLEYNLVEAEIINHEGEVVSGGLEVNVGVGAHADVGFHDGKLTVDAGFSAIFGISVKIEIDYEEGWNKLRSWFRKF